MNIEEKLKERLKIRIAEREEIIKKYDKMNISDRVHHYDIQRHEMIKINLIIYELELILNEVPCAGEKVLDFKCLEYQIAHGRCKEQCEVCKKNENF